jgi:hypothetical protein
MSLFSSILWIVALAAAVMAVFQLSRQSMKLREEIEELRAAQKAAVGGAVKARADHAPMFGGLYDE